MSKIKERIGEFLNKIKNLKMFEEKEESQDMPDAELAVEVSKQTGQDINEINKAFTEASKTVGGLTERMQKNKQRTIQPSGLQQGMEIPVQTVSKSKQPEVEQEIENDREH